MKILILTTCRTRNGPIKLEECVDKFQLITYSLCKQLANYDDIELIYDECCIRGKGSAINHTIDKHTYPQADYAILVDDMGFYKRIPIFLRKLKLVIKNAICCISNYKNHRGGEDISFYFNCNKELNKCALNFICDDELLYSNKDDQTIYIMIGNKSRRQFLKGKLNKTKDDTEEDTTDKTAYNILNKSKDIIMDIIKYAETNSKIIPIMVKQDTAQSITYMYPAKSKFFVNIKEKYDEYNKTHIYFITHPLGNEHILYELSMANILIVSPVNYISKKSVEFLNIVTYEESIPWGTIFEQLTIHGDIRDKIINNNYTFHHGTKQIISVLTNYKSTKLKIRDSKSFSSLKEKLAYDDRLAKKNMNLTRAEKITIKKLSLVQQKKDRRIHMIPTKKNKPKMKLFQSALRSKNIIIINKPA